MDWNPSSKSPESPGVVNHIDRYNKPSMMMMMTEIPKVLNFQADDWNKFCEHGMELKRKRTREMESEKKENEGD